MVSPLERRLRALEQQIRPEGRMIVVQCVGEHSDDELNAELRQHGINRRTSDDLVVFITKYEMPDGTTDDSQRAVTFVSCTPLKGRRSHG